MLSFGDRLLAAQQAHVGVDARHADPAQQFADVHLDDVAVTHHVEHEGRPIVGGDLGLATPVATIAGATNCDIES